MGILITVSAIPVMAGILVRPHPKKAPVAINSIHIKSCEKPRIIKYSRPMAILLGSLMKIENKGPGKIINAAEDMMPIVKANNIPD